MAVAHRASVAANSVVATTTFTITIPASVATDDGLFVEVTSRDASGVAPTVVDNDATGNLWTMIASDALKKATLWFKRATAATASKTITVAGCVGSASGGITALSGVDTVDPPYANLVVIDNASGDNSHIGFTPSSSGCMICLGVFSVANDNTMSSATTTSPGALTTRFQNLSTGGNDCATFHASATQASITATGNISWTTNANGVTVSMAWEVRPVGAPAAVLNAHASQAAVLSLGNTIPDARVTQAALLVLSPVPPPARISQGAVLVLSEINIEARVTQAAVLVLAELVPCITHWCECWRIERADGLVYNFTDHDRRVTFRGEVYDPCNSMTATASELGAILGSVGSMDLNGIVSDDAITEGDLFAGKLDGAVVEVWMVPWLNQGGEIPFRLSAGVCGTLQQGTVGFSMEVITDGARLQQQALLEVYGPACRFKLGDERCTKDLTAFTVTGTATVVSAPLAFNLSARRIFGDASRTEADGFFELGTLTWLVGANAGEQSEVKSFIGGTFTLWQPTVYPIVAGDAYRAVAGCDKLKQTCIDKFNNVINFGGFDSIPGADATMRTPDAKVQ